MHTQSRGAGVRTAGLWAGLDDTHTPHMQMEVRERTAGTAVQVPN